MAPLKGTGEVPYHGPTTGNPSYPIVRDCGNRLRTHLRLTVITCDVR